MKYRSVFDIIGPIMIGPSSSHTAGVVRIGAVARELFNHKIESARITFYGSFAETYRGHASDVAIVGGLLGFATDDKRIQNALQHAEEMGVAIKFLTSDAPCEHPNTIRIELSGNNKHMCIVGQSVGGGSIAITEINGFQIHLSAECPTLLIGNKDMPGAIAEVSQIFYRNNINIANMDVSRNCKGEEALMVISCDSNVSAAVLKEIAALPQINWIKQVEA